MANITFNVALGRTAELVERVNGNDPANAVFVGDLLATSGIESDAVLKDKDTFADVVSGATNFATGTGWARYNLDQASGISRVVDDTNDRVDIIVPDKTYTAVDNAADDVSAAVFGYDPDSTGGADSAIIPLTKHDWVIQPDGSDVTLDVGAAGILRIT